jgi:short-subunit dehydrogenase
MSKSWAVVTGASSGLGVAYAERMAADGANVVLVARSADKMEKVAASLRAQHGVDTLVLAVDLTDRAARAEVVELLKERDVSHLINNAGFGTIDSFHEISEERILSELELNVVALTELSRAAVPGMLSRGRGAIINVSSTAAFQAIPEMAVYAAAKAYVLRFTSALWGELKTTGVRALAVCPGPTETEFFANAGRASAMRRRRTPEQVVDATFDALGRHRPFVVDGTINKVLAFTNRLVPVDLQVAVARHVATH